MQKNMRIVVVLASLTAAGGALVASSLAQDNTVSFWVRAADSGFTAPLVKAYNASHPVQVKLTSIPDDQFVTKFGTAVAGGAGPDVVAIDLIYLPAFAEAGQMTDITAQVKALPFAKTLSDSHVRLATYQNKTYAVPFSAEGSVLVYNKALFKQAGLDPNKPPKTWAEIEAYSKKITALGNNVKGFYFAGACAGCNAFTFLPLIWASGGDVLSADGKTATLNNAAVKSALSFYRRMWETNQIPAGAKTDNGTNFLGAFLTGKIGMAGSGAFSIGILKRDHPDVDFGIAPLPGEKGGSSSFAGGDSIGIPAGSKRVKEAFDFINWCLTEDVQIKEFAKNGSIPVRSDLADNEYSKLDPRFVTVSKAMADGRTPYTVHYNELFNDANGPWLAMFQEAIFGSGVDAAVQKAQDAFTKILNTK
jgi:multiple sugar transport system substrate-binding protein